MASAGYIPCFQPVCIACAGGGMLLGYVRRAAAAAQTPGPASAPNIFVIQAYEHGPRSADRRRPAGPAAEQFEQARARVRTRAKKTVERQCQIVREPCRLLCWLLLCGGACTARQAGRSRGNETVCARQASFSNLFLCLCRARCGSACALAARWRVCGRERTRLRESWEACSAASGLSNFSWLAHAVHARRARPLPPPSLYEPQRDALRLLFDHSLQGGRRRACAAPTAQRQKISRLRPLR
jgi:hypothetical protein